MTACLERPVPTRPTTRAGLAATAVAVAIAGAAQAGDVPTYALQVIGDGYPTAINERGEIVGSFGIGSQSLAWYSDPYGRVVALPLPPGATTSVPEDINNSGLIVGTASVSGASPQACAWTLVDGAWQVELLEPLPGGIGSYATAVNDLGEIVGKTIVLGSHATLFTGPDGPVDLYTLGLTKAPADINNERQVIGEQLVLDLDDLSLVDIGAPQTPTCLWSLGIAMNDTGQVAARCVTATGSFYPVAAKFDPETGWQVLSAPVTGNTAADINNSGDVLIFIQSSGGQQPFLVIAGTGTFNVKDLLADGLEQWYPENLGAHAMNDHLQIVLVASNNATGEYGTALLTPLGEMIIPGDVNGDAVVDLDDLCAWIEAPVDLDGDGDADAADQAWLEALLADLGFAVEDCNANGVPDHCEIPGVDCPVGDLDGDGDVDGADLGLLLGAWGPCAGCPADLDGDRDVDGADLGLLLGAWGG